MNTVLCACASCVRNGPNPARQRRSRRVEHVGRGRNPDRGRLSCGRIFPESGEDDARGARIASYGQRQHIAPQKGEGNGLSGLAGRHAARSVLALPLVGLHVVRQPIPLEPALYGEVFIAIAESGGDCIQIGSVIETGLFDELLVVGLFTFALRTG